MRSISSVNEEQCSYDDAVNVFEKEFADAEANQHHFNCS